jgi:hypothetical protein
VGAAAALTESVELSHAPVSLEFGCRCDIGARALQVLVLPGSAMLGEWPLFSVNEVGCYGTASRVWDADETIAVSQLDTPLARSP